MNIWSQIDAIRAKANAGITPQPLQGPLRGNAPPPAYAEHTQHSRSRKASQEMCQRAAAQIERLGELPDDELVTTHFLVGYFGVTSGTIGKRVTRGLLPQATHTMPMVGCVPAKAWRIGDIREFLRGKR